MPRETVERANKIYGDSECSCGVLCLLVFSSARFDWFPSYHEAFKWDARKHRGILAPLSTKRRDAARTGVRPVGAVPVPSPKMCRAITIRLKLNNTSFVWKKTFDTIVYI